MKKTYAGSCHCGAVRVNCLEGVDAKELVDAPIRYFNMLNDDFKSAPAETRHL
jgi:hypothetical protein